MNDSKVVIKQIQLTEKATALSEAQNQYLFEVDPRANKLEIKKAVEALFGVQVASVNTMRYEGKRKRERSIHFGRRPSWKRAVVTLKSGSRIELA